VSSGSKKQTVGYKYYLGVHMGLAHGPLDSVVEIQVDRRVAWTGVAGDETIEVNAPLLFGGDKREGGVSGSVDIAMGLPAQVPNPYLQTQLGDDIPAFRGVACAVLNQCYMGNNPYLKPWAFKVSRTDISSGGITQWYLEKSSIIRDEDCPCDELEGAPGFLGYLVSPNADPTWDEWFPIPNITAQTGSTVLSDFNPPSVDYIEIAETADAGDVFNPCDGAPLTVFTLDSTGLLRYAPPVTTNTAFVWGIKSGDTPLLLNPLIGEGNLRILDAGGTPRGAETTIAVSLDEVGSPVYTQFDITITASNARDVGDTNTGPSSTSDTYGPYTTDPLETANLNSWTLSSLEIFADVDNRFNDGIYIYIPTTITVRIAWNGGDNTTVITKNIEWRFGTSANGTPASASVDFMNIGKNGGRIAAAGAGGTGLSAEQFSSILASWLANQAGENPCLACKDMNPAHIIRECLTDTKWGMGYASGDIDNDAFTTAADTLYSENMGISIIWDRELPLEDFIGEILRHIDAVLYVSRRTGKFVLKLIREETPTITLDESNISEVNSAKIPTVSELTNMVNVVYWEATTDENASVTRHNDALIQTQGVEIATTIQYPGFTNLTMAQRVAERDLRALSTPLLSCEVVANRDAAQLNIGDPFTLDWPDLNINNVVMRANEIMYGDGIDNSVKIIAMQDVFSVPPSTSLAATTEEWIDPISVDPVAAVARIITEVPYYVLVVELGQDAIDDILTADAGAGFLLASAGRAGTELNADVLVDAGAGFESSANLDFHGYAYADGAVGQFDTVIAITGDKDLDLVETGTIAQIGDELVRVDSINDSSPVGGFASITVGRGILDTTPRAHDSGTAIAFWGDFAVSDDEQYADAENVDVKLLTTQGPNTLSQSDAPTDTVVFDSRGIRPYPPGNFQIDGSASPETVAWVGNHTFTWAHRDRTQQTAGDLFDHTEGNIGPEPGVTYRIEGYAYGGSPEAETQFIDVTLSGSPLETSWTYDSAAVAASPDVAQDPPTDTERVVIKIYSVRDGYDSWQAAEIALPVGSPFL
jgi:hypothetical protein